MTDKKIIIISVIFSILLIGGAWYYSRGGNLSPRPSDSSLTGEPGILIGDPNAPVLIEEYTSFVCPACGRFATITLGQIINDYVKTGKVKMMFYVFPPELSPAALCSQEQNKFTEFHQYVFDHQAQITGANDMKDMATNAGLNSQKFDACFASGKYQDKIDKWIGDGDKRAVEYTPTFFINGQKLVGAQPFEDFKKIIDAKLNQAQ